MKEFLLKQYPPNRHRLSRPVVASVFHYKHAERVTWHQHKHAQLVFPMSGVVRVLTPKKTWTLPQSRALWLPPDIDHELHAVGELQLCSVYLEPEVWVWAWAETTVIEATPLLRELALAMSADGDEYSPDSRAALTVPLLLRVLGDSTKVPGSGLPLPSDARLLAICEHLMLAPDSDYSLDLWGERFGASGRTLARRFKVETGMTFGLWRQHLCVSEAITRLALGRSVARVSSDLGYSSPSAFIAMFRHVTGDAPQRYLASV